MCYCVLCVCEKQDLNGLLAGKLTTIHQPVLTWGDQTEGGQYNNSWHLWSWTCCEFLALHAAALMSLFRCLSCVTHHPLRPSWSPWQSPVARDTHHAPPHAYLTSSPCTFLSVPNCLSCQLPPLAGWQQLMVAVLMSAHQALRTSHGTPRTSLASTRATRSLVHIAFNTHTERACCKGCLAVGDV